MLRGITPKSVLEHLLFAVIGGWLYMSIEVMWRGYTHWSMGVLGGVCFVAVGLLNEIQQRPLWRARQYHGAGVPAVYAGVGRAVGGGRLGRGPITQNLRLIDKNSRNFYTYDRAEARKGQHEERAVQ